MDTDQRYQILFALLVGIALGILAVNQGLLQAGPGQLQEPSIGAGSQRVIVQSNATTALPEIFEAAEDSVVSVRTEGGGPAAQGSGFVYDTRGHIVTNEHVVEDAEEVEVTFPSGIQLQAEIVGTDPFTDLAVLEIDSGEIQLNPLPIGTTEQMKVGEHVAAIGNPFGLSGTMTAGILSQKNRLLRTEGRFSIPNVLQTDAAINPGNSGGPLLNMQGEVIGVNTAITSGSGTFSGVGFAVSAETLERVVPRLIEQGGYRHPWIGVSGVDVSPEIREAMDLETASGFLIVEVVDDSPASRAGLEAGDREIDVDGGAVTVGGDVIVGIGGRNVRKIDDILNYLAKETSVGETVTLEIIRDGEVREVDLTLGRRPQPG